MYLLQEKLQKLSQENAELRDLCLFLNQMAGSDSIQQPKLIPPQVDQYSVHAACVMDLSKSQALDDVPRYTGFIGKESIVDKIVQNPNNGSGHQATTCTSVGDISTTSKSNGTAINDYVSKLEKRLEKIEMEKLELVKVLCTCT